MLELEFNYRLILKIENKNGNYIQKLEICQLPGVERKTTQGVLKEVGVVGLKTNRKRKAQNHKGLKRMRDMVNWGLEKVQRMEGEK